jgi:hypothetical protein
MLSRVMGVSSFCSVRNTVMATIWKIHTHELMPAKMTDSFVARKEFAPDDEKRSQREGNKAHHTRTGFHDTEI